MLLRIRAFFSNEQLIIILTLLGYVVILFSTLFHHELWHEEMQGWLIAQDAHSFTSLYHNLRYESHPMLWYLLLFVISRFTANPLWMQLLNGLIASLVVFIFLRYAPFRLYQRILFVFGYFPLFEYGVLSRNYLLTMLFLFLFCLFFLKKKYWLTAGSLILVMQTSLPGLILGFLLSIFFIFTVLARKIVFVLVLLIGAIISALQIFPASDYGITVDWVTKFELKRFLMSLLMLWRGYFPIPRLSTQFWNTNILIPNFMYGTFDPTVFSFFGLGSALLFSVLILLISGFYFRTTFKVLLLFYAGTFSLLIFFYVFYYGAVRHWGFLYLFFICCLWIAQSNISKYRLYVFTILLCAQLYSGLFAVFADVRYVFAAGKQTAAYLLHKNVPFEHLIGDLDTHVVSVAGYLHTSIYYPRERIKGSFAIVKRERTEFSEEALLHSAVQESNDGRKERILVLNYPLLYPHCGVRLEKTFLAEIASSDSFYIYRVSPTVAYCSGL